MSVSAEDLSFETHIDHYRHFLRGNKSDTYWYHQAQDMHSRCVIDALTRIQGDVVILAQRIQVGSAHYNLLFGVARRSRLIWSALRHLFVLIPPDRTEPLPSEAVYDAERALNDIYIHSRGALDNYAWAISDLFGDGNLKKLHQNDVGLFRSKFRNNPSVSDFGAIAKEFVDWETELKERRDPVAHRIPLTVPPSFLDADDLKKRSQLQEQWNEGLSEIAGLAERNAPTEDIDAVSARMNSIQARMEKLGSFKPIIVHDPEKGGVPLYPTVSNDIGQLILLARKLNRCLDARLDILLQSSVT